MADAVAIAVAKILRSFMVTETKVIDWNCFYCSQDTNSLQTNFLVFYPYYVGFPLPNKLTLALHTLFKYD